MKRRTSATLLLFLFCACAMAQQRTDIFVTPIPNAPFSGAVAIQRQIVAPNGSVIALKTIRGMGRDSKGRIFSEARALVPASSSAPPVLTGIFVYDPRTRTSTKLDPRTRTFRSETINRPPAIAPPGLDFGSPSRNAQPPGPETTHEDLGTRELNHLAVHGVRETQTLPAEKSGTGQPVVITDEYWYSPDLHMNLALKHTDPRRGSVTMAVTQLTLAEPDAALFEIPEGYHADDSVPDRHGRE